MGIWDNVSTMLGKGADAAGRFANATNLKFKLGEEQRKRRDLAAELGESLYETVTANPSLAAGRERILADMAACDVEIARIKEEVDRIAQRKRSPQSRGRLLFVSCMREHACPQCAFLLHVRNSACALAFRRLGFSVRRSRREQGPTARLLARAFLSGCVSTACAVGPAARIDVCVRGDPPTAAFPG